MEVLNHYLEDACTPIFIATLFTIANTWKSSKCPSTHEWIKKIGIWIHICNAILISCKKKKEILLLVTSWMELDSIMLSEIIQTEKDKYCMISLICEIIICEIWKYQTQRNRDQNDGCQDLSMLRLVKWYKLSFK